MGWTFTNRSKGQPIKDFFAERFDFDEIKNGVRHSGKILDCAMKRWTEVYISYEIINGDERKVVALVCLVRFNREFQYNFGYKDMDETMGPCICDCPERILKALTPTDDKTSNEWRQACQERIDRRKNKPKLKVGDVIEFNYPLHFGSYGDIKQFRILPKRNPRQRRVLVTTADNDNDWPVMRIRTTTIQEGDWKIIKKAS